MAESVHEMEIAMKHLLDTGEGADLTLVCRGKSWKVHSSCLWPRSSWFKAACKGGFKESETQRMELPEEEPSMVYRMLQHLYMQTYIVDLGVQDLDKSWSSGYSLAVTWLNKYDVPSLKKEAARRFSEDMEALGNRKGQTLTLLSVVPTVYTTTPDSDRELRNLLVRHLFERYNTASKHFVEELDTALEIRQFARDIIVLHLERPPINNAAVAGNVYRIYYRYIRPLPAATISYLSTAVALPVSLQAALIHSGLITCFLLASLLSYLILFGHAEVEIGVFERRPHSNKCWARDPRGIEDWSWRVCWPWHSDKIKITFE